MKTVQRKCTSGFIFTANRFPHIFPHQQTAKEIYSPEKGLFLSANNQLSMTMQNRMFIFYRRTELGDEKQGCFEITGRYKNGSPEGGGKGEAESIE
jgi:histidinol phosphatase-like enzyme